MTNKLANRLLGYVVKLIQQQRGQGMTEYGLIIGLIAIVVIGALTLMGGTLVERFNDIIRGLGGTP